MFHIYHAYESIVSAFIASFGYPVPPAGGVRRGQQRAAVPTYTGPGGRQFSDPVAHTARLTLFTQLADPVKRYTITHNRLRTFVPYSLRNDTLYYDARTGRLPQDRFRRLDVDQAYGIVRRFGREVWADIQ
jgi:hypothetical protein